MTDSVYTKPKFRKKTHITSYTYIQIYHDISENIKVYTHALKIEFKRAAIK